MIPDEAICDHCGLPTSPGRRIGGKLYCCYGCRLVSRLVGDKDHQSLRAWNLLRLGVGAFLAMNVMMISVALYTNTVEPATVPLFHWIMLAMSAGAIAILVYPLVQGSAQEIRRGRLSLDTLIAVGALTAFGVSAANVLRGSGHVYFDTATMLPLLVTFGKMIEAAARSQARDLVRSLQSLLPPKALRVTPAFGEVGPDELRIGDRIRVRPGERFAADGIIVEGATSVAEAAFTGEAAEQHRGAGDSVIAGCVNGAGSVVVEARNVGSQLLLCRIVRMVQQAQVRQGPAQRSAQRMAAVFTPLVLGLAAATGLAWAISGQASQAAMAALAVLVVACPCAMGIAVPLATATAIATAARNGVLVRGGDVMERLAHVSAVFLDKTGTLTLGSPAVRTIEPADAAASPDRLLATLAGLESASEHVLARAIMDEAKRRKLPIPPVKDVEVFPGLGLGGNVMLDGRWQSVLAGSEEFLQNCRQAPAGAVPGAASGAVAAARAAAPDRRRNRRSEDGASRIALAVAGRLWGTVLLDDMPREDASAALDHLRALGMKIALLSGDSAEATAQLAAQLGIANAHARCRPDQKIAMLDQAKAGGQTTAMVGDGINDAPALAQADVGIALGAGTDLARQSANVVLLSNRLEQIPWLIALGRRTRRIIRQNLLWAIGYNCVALAAAASGHLHPLLAAVAMVASSLTLLGNSVRLAR